MSKLTVVRSKHKPDQTYEEFKEARLQGFGASDIGSLLNEGDYSCKRRLFLERLGLMPEEQDDRLAFHVERGKFFEGPVAGLYSLKSGRVTKEAGTGYIKEFPFMRANTDRFQYRPLQEGSISELGVLEIKVPSAHMFRKIKKEGLSQSYILQLQWQMLCYGTSWGSFAVYWADGHELLWFDVERDEGLILELIGLVKSEWKMLADVKLRIIQGEEWKHALGIPERLDSHAKACEKCPMYQECHGLVFSSEGLVLEREDLTVKAQEFLRIKDEIKYLELREKELKNAFRDAFKEYPCSYLKAGGFNIKVSERMRENLSSKVKEILTPEQRLSYVSNTTYEVVDVREQK